MSDTTINWDYTATGIEESVGQDVIAPPGGKPITAEQDHSGFYHSDPDSFPTQPIVTTHFSDGTGLDYCASNPSFIVAVSSNTLNSSLGYSGYSTDGGQTWTTFSGSGAYSDLYGGNIAVSATDPTNIVWLPTNNKMPYVTTDQGKTWTQLTAFNNVKTLHTMIWWASKKALDSDKVIGGQFYIYSTDSGGEFFRSSDGGHAWTQTASAPPSTGNDAHVFGQIRAVPGHANNVWASVAQGGLWYTQDGGDSWTQISGVQQARSFGFGTALGGSDYPTIFLDSQINNEWGIWRSTDQGQNWDLLSQYPYDLADQVNTVNGDMNIPGRVYVGFAGDGFVYGDSQAPATSIAITLNPTDDRDNWSNHNGSETVLYTSVWEMIYLKFDLSALSGKSVNAAYMRLYRVDTSQGTMHLTAYQVNDTSWNESDTNLPSPGSAITSVMSSAVGYTGFDVTGYVQAAVAANQSQLAIAIQGDSANWQGFFSKENGEDIPMLTITAS